MNRSSYGLIALVVVLAVLPLALPNPFYAAAVTAYVSDILTDPGQTAQVTGLAFVHGYHVAFFWGAVLFGLALRAGRSGWWGAC